MEIGTWSNAMAENINMNDDFDGDDDDDEEEWNEMLPPNISICSRSNCNSLNLFIFMYSLLYSLAFFRPNASMPDWNIIIVFQIIIHFR